MSGEKGAVALAARPAAIALPLGRTAIVVNDMQNAFCSKGGYLDQAGFDITGARDVIARVGAVLRAARQAGIPVFYSQNGFDAALSDAAPTSPWHEKSNALSLMRRRPELAGLILIKGSWDYAIIDELAPEPGDIVFAKTRPSCFAGTALDMMLRARDVTHIVVIGIASNVGVEWTLRDGLSREYYGIMIEDATMPAGPAFVHDAAVFNVTTFIGWVTRAADFIAALSAVRASP